jgi:hypothetical protein
MPARPTPENRWLGRQLRREQTRFAAFLVEVASQFLEVELTWHQANSLVFVALAARNPREATLGYWRAAPTDHRPAYSYSREALVLQTDFEGPGVNQALDRVLI